MSDEKNFISSIPLDEGYSHIFNKQAAFLSNVNVGNNLHADNSLYATNTVYSSADVTEKMLVFEDRQKSFIVTQLGKPEPGAKTFAIALCDATVEDASVYGSIVFDSPTSNSLNRLDITLTVVNGEAKGQAMYNLDNEIIQIQLCKFVDKKLYYGLYVSDENISVDSIWFYGFVRYEMLDFGRFSHPEEVEAIPLLNTFYENNVVFKSDTFFQKNIYKKNEEGNYISLASEDYVDKSVADAKEDLTNLVDATKEDLINKLEASQHMLLDTIENSYPKCYTVGESSERDLMIVMDSRVHVIPNIGVTLRASNDTRLGTILNVFALNGCAVSCIDQNGMQNFSRSLKPRTMMTFAYFGTWVEYGVHGAVWND